MRYIMNYLKRASCIESILYVYAYLINNILFNGITRSRYATTDAVGLYANCNFINLDCSKFRRKMELVATVPIDILMLTSCAVCCAQHANIDRLLSRKSRFDSIDFSPHNIGTFFYLVIDKSHKRQYTAIN